MGLTGSIVGNVLAYSLSNGTEYLTSNELALHQDAVKATNQTINHGGADIAAPIQVDKSLEKFAVSKRESLNSRASGSSRFLTMNKKSGQSDAEGSVTGTKTEVYNGDGSETHYYFNLNGDLTAVIEKGANGNLSQTYNKEAYNSIGSVNYNNGGNPSNGVFGTTTTFASKENVIDKGTSQFGDYYKLSTTTSYQGKQSVLNVNTTISPGKSPGVDVSLNLGPVRVTVNPLNASQSASVLFGAMRVSVGINNGTFQFGTTVRNSRGFGISSNFDYRPGGYSAAGAIIIIEAIAEQFWAIPTTLDKVPPLLAD